MCGNDLNIALKSIKVQTNRKLFYYYHNNYLLFNKEQLQIYHNRDNLNCEVLIKTLMEIECKSKV